MKKKMYLEACLQKRCHFSLFVASIDGLLDVGAAATLKIISRHLAKKGQKPYLRICGYAKSRIAITLVWAMHWCIQGSKVPSHQIRV